MTQSPIGPTPDDPIQTTGRYLVLLDEDDQQAGLRALREATGVSVTRASGAEAEDAGDVLFEELGVAVVDTPPDAVPGLRAAARDSSAVLLVEPERYVYALDTVAAPTTGTDLGSYLRGYRDGVGGVVDGALGAGDNGRVAASGMGTRQAWDQSQATWGLQATRALDSVYTGKGVRVAVLDTGFDVEHPDFEGRTVVTRSFIQNEDVQDMHGHGTHCIGTALGPRRPAQLPGYGVAYEAEIYAGKVLSNSGSGSDGGILRGISWAIRNDCRIVSMSLGAPTQPGESFSQVYENVARRALRRGTLIIAAAGNESRRQNGVIRPVGRPANCPSILAVAALDDQFGVAWFACGGINPNGGEVNIAGPGVDVYSSWPMPTRNRFISGTSMATPHVAGIAALMVQAKPSASANEIGELLTQSAQALSLPTRDAGAGLVQAP